MKIFQYINYLIIRLKQNRRINVFDINIFLRQFTTLFTAGIPIIKCFEILEKCQMKNSLRLIIYSIKREMLSGKDLYSSLSHYHLYFDEMTCQLIKIGEHTGRLDMMLNMITNEKDKYFAFKKQLKQALFYPLIITISAVVVTLCMFLFIVPKFADLFSHQNKLPLITTLIFFISKQLQENIFILFFIFGFIVFLMLPHKFFIPIKNNLFRFLIKLPFVKSFMQKIMLARFSRNLAMTCTAGIPITDALTLIKYANINMELTQWIIKLRSKINSGLQLHQAMALQPCFPELMIHMIKIGEESGNVEHLLHKLADIFEADIHQFLTQASQLLEPLIMLILGVLIGGLVIGMYLPIFKLGSVL